MDKKKYMSGSELRQYLHISTRKMKYLMDHDYIPHENTGNQTHKYLVLREDAKAFKHRMKYEKGFLSELSGIFSSRVGTKIKEAPKPLTPEEREKIIKKLQKEWKNYPDALPSKTAAELLGLSLQQIYRLISNNELHAVKIGGVQLVSKEDAIEYIAYIKRN